MSASLGHEEELPEAEHEADSFTSSSSGDSDSNSPSLHRRPSQHSADTNCQDVDDFDRQLQELMPKIAQKISGMEVVNPEVLRVTRACQAFQQFAAPLRAVGGNYFHKSCKSHKISTFWSHSWHGGYWKKILTLITFYNGTAAVFLALMTGVGMMVLFSQRLLPGFDRQWYEKIEWSAWSLFSGFLVAALVLVFWQPQSRVFLDRICISQDGELKSQAIFSLAGLLKNSDSMLVLWDPTWTDRLWCLFELAAFLKSRKNHEQALIVRPIFLGPISIAVFITIFAAMIPVVTVPVGDPWDIIVPIGVVISCGLLVAFATVSTLRNYFRDLDIMKQQLLLMSFDTTRSSCCDRNHVSSSGAPMLCDRKIVKECVNIWFGSQQAFEATVGSQVLDILNRDLTERVFSMAWCLGVTSPLLLAFMDLSATFTFMEWRDMSWLEHPSMALLLEGLIFWAALCLGTKDLLIQSCRLLRKKPKNQALEMLKNAACVLVVLFPLTLFLAVYALSRFVSFNSTAPRAAAFAAGALSLVACNISLGMGLKVLSRRPGW